VGREVVSDSLAMNGLAVGQTLASLRKRTKNGTGVKKGVVRTDCAENVDGDLDGTQDGVFTECRCGKREEIGNSVGTERVGIRDEANRDVEKPDRCFSLSGAKYAIESLYASDTNVLLGKYVFVCPRGHPSKMRLVIDGVGPFARMDGLGIVLRVTGVRSDHGGRARRREGTVSARHYSGAIWSLIYQKKRGGGKNGLSDKMVVFVEAFPRGGNNQIHGGDHTLWDIRLQYTPITVVPRMRVDVWDSGGDAAPFSSFAWEFKPKNTLSDHRTFDNRRAQIAGVLRHRVSQEFHVGEDRII